MRGQNSRDSCPAPKNHVSNSAREDHVICALAKGDDAARLSDVAMPRVGPRRPVAFGDPAPPLKPRAFSTSALMERQFYGCSRLLQHIFMITHSKQLVSGREPRPPTYYYGGP